MNETDQRHGELDPKYVAMQRFRISDVAMLYECIVRYCQTLDDAAAVAPTELASTIPRPLQPELGIPLGTMVDTEADDPASTSAAQNQLGEREQTEGSGPNEQAMPDA